MEIPTKRVRVLDSGHEVTINASDFDEVLHEEIGTPKVPKAPKVPKVQKGKESEG
jgi:hypothetical protein